MFWPVLVHGQEILKQLQAPGSEPRGLTWDGHSLWCADASAQRVYQIDPDDGQIISSFDYSMDFQYGGLGWSPEGYLWITDYRESQSWFDKVHPTSGSVISSFHCPGG
ncbi:MAG: hypothetical protein JSV84_06820 [Gemmatimonadota bacterium]|nr:MAG: hypothetical protein JSV84_06820 [Gemmatimonadota bacterium]